MSDRSDFAVAGNLALCVEIRRERNCDDADIELDVMDYYGKVIFNSHAQAQFY